MIRIVGKRGKGSFESQLDEAAKGLDFVQIDCTSGNSDKEFQEGLSPFYIGPVECYDGLKSETFERAWQCAKVYPWFADANGNPSEKYFVWRDEMWGKKGFESKSEIRFPAGKGNVGKCLYAWWKVDGQFKKLGYVEARKMIYMPVYAKAVWNSSAFKRLCELRDSGKNLMLIDFEGYNIHHPHYNFTYTDAIHCPILKMGHGFVLAMMLEGLITVEDGEVKYAEGLMTPPHREWPRELRALSADAKRARNASALGVTPEVYDTLDETTRKWLRKAATKAEVGKCGIKRTAWKRLPLEEKLEFMNGTN